LVAITGRNEGRRSTDVRAYEGARFLRVIPCEPLNRVGVQLPPIGRLGGDDEPPWQRVHQVRARRPAVFAGPEEAEVERPGVVTERVHDGLQQCGLAGAGRPEQHHQRTVRVAADQGVAGEALDVGAHVGVGHDLTDEPFPGRAGRLFLVFGPRDAGEPVVAPVLPELRAGRGQLQRAVGDRDERGVGVPLVARHGDSRLALGQLHRRPHDLHGLGAGDPAAGRDGLLAVAGNGLAGHDSAHGGLHRREPGGLGLVPHPPSPVPREPPAERGCPRQITAAERDHPFGEADVSPRGRRSEQLLAHGVEHTGPHLIDPRLPRREERVAGRDCDDDAVVHIPRLPPAGCPDRTHRPCEALQGLPPVLLGERHLEGRGDRRRGHAG